MDRKIVSMPVTVDQIAAVVRHMSVEERRHLLDLVPELEEAVRQRMPRTRAQAQAAVEAMRQEIMAGLEGHPLSPEEPFLGELSLGAYLALPDEERARLWDEWAEEDTVSWNDEPLGPEAVGH